MKHLVIILFLLTGCKNYHSNSIAFISPATINFKNLENEQPDKVEFVDTLIIHNKDTIKVGAGYSVMKLDVNYQNDKRHYVTYYFLSNSKLLYDDVFLTYYDHELFCIRIFTKDSARVDSLSKVIENYYNKNFSLNRNSFRRDRLYIDKTWKWVSSETEFRIFNSRVDPPPFCNTTKWYNYLAFWHWF